MRESIQVALKVEAFLPGRPHHPDRGVSINCRTTMGDTGVGSIAESMYELAINLREAGLINWNGKGRTLITPQWSLWMERLRREEALGGVGIAGLIADLDAGP
jgi:hypothetical protein